jgi:hypothetical protein
MSLASITASLMMAVLGKRRAQESYIGARGQQLTLADRKFPGIGQDQLKFLGSQDASMENKYNQALKMYNMYDNMEQRAEFMLDREMKAARVRIAMGWLG